MAEDWIESVLLKYSPKHARKRWIYVNSFVLTCSILLLIEIAMTLEPEDRLEGTRAYLAYNTVVCFVWTIESGLHFLQYKHDQKNETEQQEQRQQQESNTPNEGNYYCGKNGEFYALIVELIFAIYFLFDSVTAFKIMWQQPSGIGAQLFDVSIDAVAYIYLLTRLVMFTEEGDASENNNNQAQNNEGTPYVGAEMT